MKPNVGQIFLGALLGVAVASVLDVAIVAVGTVLGGIAEGLFGSGRATMNFNWDEFKGIWSMTTVISAFTGMVVFALLKKINAQKLQTLLVTIVQYALTGLVIGAVAGFVVAISGNDVDAEVVTVITGAGTMLGAWIGSYYAVRES